MSAFDLTPELRKRLERIAEAEKKTLKQVLCEAVQEYWIRYATRNRLNQGEW